jgi:hypothetical protein
MKNAEIIAKIQAKVDQCRRLAEGTTDPRTALTLRGMADEGERDIQRIREEGTEGPDTSSVTPKNKRWGQPH